MQLLSLILSLLMVQDPLGNIPVCLSLLNAVSSSRRAWFIVRENLIAFCLTSLFLISGAPLLKSLNISPASLGIAGGVILFRVAYEMMFSKPNASAVPSDSTEPWVVPLATPLLAGPALIANILTYTTQHPESMGYIWLALAIVSLVSTAILLLALPLYHWLGSNLIHAISKIMGMILMAMAVEMVLSNGMAYFKLHHSFL